MPSQQCSHIYVMLLFCIIHIIFQYIRRSRPISSAEVNLKNMTSVIKGSDADRLMGVSLPAGVASGR